MKGKVALITGGGTGIGKACARRLASEGVKVAVMGRRGELLEQVAREIDGLALTGDASNTSEMKKALSQTKERFGGVDFLISSAGGHGLGDVLATDDSEWQLSLDANLNTAFVAARETMPCLIEREGAAVFISCGPKETEIARTVPYDSVWRGRSGLNYTPVASSVPGCIRTRRSVWPGPMRIGFARTWRGVIAIL